MGPTGVEEPLSGVAEEVTGTGAGLVVSDALLEDDEDVSDELDSDDTVVRVRRLEERDVGVLAPNALK